MKKENISMLTSSLLGGGQNNTIVCIKANSNYDAKSLRD